MKKNLLVFSLAAACSGWAQAADVELKIATWLPPSHSVNSVFLPKLIGELEKRTEGRVSAKVEYDLAAPNGLLELVEYGGADISWTYNGYFPGRFVTTKLIELPGYEGNSSAASVAHWRAHDKYLQEAGEYDGVELIGLMVHGPAFLFMKNEIDGLKAVEGRKMRAGGGVANEVATALKTSPILAPASKSYEMIMGGMADGTMLPADVIPSFRLYEAAPYAYTLPGGFYRGSFALFMNENALDKASFRMYSRKNLNAIHARCNCVVLPATAVFDPGRGMNEADLKRVYRAAGGSTYAGDLLNTRVSIREHGELGQVLTYNPKRGWVDSPHKRQYKSPDGSYERLRAVQELEDVEFALKVLRGNKGADDDTILRLEASRRELKRKVA